MKNFKQRLIGIALAASLSTSVMAGECSFSGFYLGAQLGYGSGNLKSDDQIKVNLGTSGVIGGLHVGYGRHFPNRFYMGTEVYGNLAHQTGELKIKEQFDKIKVNYKKVYAYGAKLRPGIVVGNALVYGVIGVERAHFKNKVSVDDGVGNSTSKSESDSRWGFVPGLGVAFNVTDHVILGLEATHTFYQKKSGNSVRATDALARVSYKW